MKHGVTEFIRMILCHEIKKSKAYKSKVLFIIIIIIIDGDVKQSGESRCNQDFHNYNKSIVFA